MTCLFSEKTKRTATPEVLILDNDIDNLKAMRESLTANNCKVKAVRTSVEAVNHIRDHHPNIFIIGHDSSGVAPRDVYDSLENVIRQERVIPLVMEENFFSTELIERVNEALNFN